MYYPYWQTNWYIFFLFYTFILFKIYYNFYNISSWILQLSNNLNTDFNIYIFISKSYICAHYVEVFSFIGFSPVCNGRLFVQNCLLSWWLVSPMAKLQVFERFLSRRYLRGFKLVSQYMSPDINLPIEPPAANLTREWFDSSMSPHVS